MTFKSAAKILFYDVETFPNIAYTWGKYDQNVIRFKQETCMATFAAKWADGPVFAKALPDYEHYVPGSYDDKELVTDLWKLFDEADIVVAHNGKSFDTKVSQARFIVHGLLPPAPFKQVDTKDMTKSVARFNSNKLDDLSQILGFGKKIKTDFDLWEGCINGDKKCWKQMVEYNKKDVLLLEKVYLSLLPWTKHPNLAVYDNKEECPRCGSNKIQYRGTCVTTTCSYQRFQCQSCGGWGRSTKQVNKVAVAI